ncbi:MAG TPA: NADP oxidoreductase, partial [Streptomyces sp.]|nr:NADP oxidoreductase [Streptomyces sp.]
GHDVVVGTRDPAATAQRNVLFRIVAERHPELTLTTFAEAVPAADLVVNAISGPRCVGALTPLAPSLDRRTVMDVSSPFDFSTDDVVLDPVNTDSLGEQLQRALPGARVVKTLNTLAADVMTNPTAAGGGDHSVFVSGEDTGAKAMVADLLRSLGWNDVIDLGGIRTARATEMMLPMWMALSGAVSTHLFGFKIVR